MTESEIVELAAKITAGGLAGKPETTLLEGFCARAAASGLPIARAIVFIDTLHPIHEGRAFRWERARREATLTEYGRNNEGERAERWRTSPHYHMLENGHSSLRRRIGATNVDEFPMFRELHAAGISDYVAFINRFAAERAIGDMDCVYSMWMADGDGFSEADVAALERLMPFLGLALKSASLGRIAETLVVTYLGRDAGRRVLRGQIGRGVTERIEAVLWFSDLRNYTRISDTSSPDEIIPLLNDYGEAVVSAIHENGGDVLKLIGDGVLAIFPAERPSNACAAALNAARAAQESVGALSGRRAAEGLPFTEMYLALHIGEVFYGNIGSNERLDFTVVGPAVNEVSRITAMCRSVDQPLLLSAAFAAAATDASESFISVGRYALRGVGRPQDLFTLESRR
jgi:adenylate cyclase